MENTNDVMEFNAMNRIPKKGEIIVDEKIQRAKGGGLLIFRTIKKVKEKTKKVYAKIEQERKERPIDMDKLSFSMSEDEGEKVDLKALENACETA